jgi:hypothetical protein
LIFAEAIFRFSPRLFEIGLMPVIALGVIETNFGNLETPFLRTALAAYVLVGMIVTPSLVLTRYFLVVCSLAIVALVKILQIASRTRAQRLRA